MERVHLVGDDEDLYSGFNDYNAILDTEDLENDTAFQEAVARTSHGRRPPMTMASHPSIGGMRQGTAARGGHLLPSSMGRIPTASQDSLARPMTAVRGAGYTSAGHRGNVMFDPLNQASKGTAPPLEPKEEDSPEDHIKALEKKVNELIEASCMANSQGEFKQALEKAKEAGNKERTVVRQREQMQAGDQINLDLTYFVLFNLANQYAANEMYTEALNTYQVIVKNKLFSNAGRIKLNIGNIYFKQRNYPKAIKFYRMALDQVPNTHKDMRMKILQNIGLTFVKIGQYNDAITTFEHIVAEKPEFVPCLNLMLCYYALGDKEKMKKTFHKMLQVQLNVDDDKYLSHTDDLHSNLILEVIKNDSLRQLERRCKQHGHHCILTAAKLISPVIENTFAQGFDWCVEAVKASSFAELANDLEINKAIMFLKQKDFNQAVECLKGFEKKDTKVASAAATNLAFLYFLQNDLSQADHYVELAMTADHYNPAALVNKGNCVYQQGDYEKAQEYYKEALNNESSCVEALYNLGLANKKLGMLEEALECFFKLHAIILNHPQVIYQIAHLHDMLEDVSQATEWFMQLVGIIPSDPAVLAQLGEIYDNDGDKSQAFQYHYDSYRHYPSNIEVIEWLGTYYIDSQFCEKAIHYFERAALIQPNQVKWQLMIASCHRRSGSYQQALETYKNIHKKFPENVECLKFLVRLCTDLGLKEAADYAIKLKKAEKAKELREHRNNSARVYGSSRGSRQGSAGSDSSSGNKGVSARGQRSGVTSGHLHQVLTETTEQYEMSKAKEIDSSYSDPLGPQAERPKTAARKKDFDDDFDNEELGDDLLPE